MCGTAVLAVGTSSSEACVYGSAVPAVDTGDSCVAVLCLQ